VVRARAKARIHLGFDSVFVRRNRRNALMRRFDTNRDLRRGEGQRSMDQNTFELLAPHEAFSKIEAAVGTVGEESVGVTLTITASQT
jgi:hypothetical protein